MLTNRIWAKPKADSVIVPKNNNHIGDEISTVRLVNVKIYIYFFFNGKINITDGQFW